jgi:hypothetical protein
MTADELQQGIDMGRVASTMNRLRNRLVGRDTARPAAERLPAQDERVGKGMSAVFELTKTVIHHDWEQVEHEPGGEETWLSLSAGLRGAVRGTVRRPSIFHHRLGVDDWKLTGPVELEAVWAQRARYALAQLGLRVAGRPHTAPAPGGRWDVSVRHRLRVTGAPEVPSGLAAAWTFTPTQVFVEASTNGAGSVLLFGAGPVETDSTRYDFAVGLGGVVAFTRLDPDHRVPVWAQDLALEAARQAFELCAAADSMVSDETTGPRVGA